MDAMRLMSHSADGAGRSTTFQGPLISGFAGRNPKIPDPFRLLLRGLMSSFRQRDDGTMMPPSCDPG
jgi:hypothetical protein